MRLGVIRSTISLNRLPFCLLLFCITLSAQERTLPQQKLGKNTSPMSTTEVSEDAFHLTLPGKWTTEEAADSARWNYRSEDGREGLTVSLMTSKDRMNPEKQRGTLNRMAELHRKVVTKVFGPAALTMYDTTFGETNGVMAARYGGTETATHRRFHSLLLCSPLAVTVFFYEAVGLPEKEADARAKAIMNSIAVPK